jgi:hypothetical protein
LNTPGGIRQPWRANQNSLAGLIVELTAGEIEANDPGARRRRLNIANRQRQQHEPMVSN